MGCDIHLVVQTKRDGKWLTQKWKNPHRALADTPEDADDFGPELTADYDVWRNYSLFAVLAGVRNDWGVTPLSPPRGLPESLTRSPSDDEVHLSPDGEEVWLGDHSHSWLGYEELTDPAYWQQTARLEYYVPEDECARLLKDGDTPRRWSSALGQGVVELSFEQMQARIEAPVEEKMLQVLSQEEVAYVTRMQWHEPYNRLAGQLYTELLPRLAELRAQEGVEDVRIVFGFDS